MTFQINVCSVNDVVSVKSTISRNIDNSSEDGLYNFILVSCIEGGIFSKIWCGCSCFDILDDLKIVFVCNMLKWDEVNKIRVYIWKQNFRSNIPKETYVYRRL